MQMRVQLDRRKRRVMSVVYVAFGLFAASTLLCPALGQPDIAVYLVAPSFAVFFFGLLYAHYFAFRCLRCRGNLAPLVLHGAGFSLDRRIQFCPWCGCGLDEEILPIGEPGTGDPSSKGEAVAEP